MKTETHEVTSSFFKISVDGRVTHTIRRGGHSLEKPVGGYDSYQLGWAVKRYYKETIGYYEYSADPDIILNAFKEFHEAVLECTNDVESGRYDCGLDNVRARILVES